MYNILEDALEQLVEDQLKDNPFAKGLLFLLRNQNKLPTIAQLVAIPLEKTAATTEEVGRDRISIQGKDYRFEALYLKGIRKFQSNNELYTIKFTNDGNPVSSVFLGNNGIGKSSIFAALEYASLGHSYLGDERGYGWSPGSQKIFLTHNEVNASEATIDLYTKDDEIKLNLDGQRVPIVPQAFFCSEYDIQKISREGLTTRYIGEQLGLDRFLDLLDIFDKFTPEEDEINIFKDNELRINKQEIQLHVKSFLLNVSFDDLEKIIPIIDAFDKHSNNRTAEFTIEISRIFKKHFSKEDIFLNNQDKAAIKDLKYVIDESSSILHDIYLKKGCRDELFEKFVSLVTPMIELWKAEITNIHDLSVNNERHTYLEGFAKLYHENEVLRDSQSKKIIEKPLLNKSEDFIRFFNETNNTIRIYYRRTISEYIEVINSILPPVFKDYFDKDIRKIYAELHEKDLTIDIKIEPCNPVNGISDAPATEPRKFLNTFRFKMFCFVLKFSLFCCVKKYHTFNFPFSVDDVFDSSDFEHRNDIGKLIVDIKGCHDNIDGMKDYPLQLIFFTQDNVIAEAIRSMFFPLDEIKFSRLFDYYDATDDEKQYLPDNQTRIVTIEDRL